MKLKQGFWLRKCIFINKDRLRLDSLEWNEVFGEVSVFSLINGGVGWIYRTEARFLDKQVGFD